MMSLGGGKSLYDYVGLHPELLLQRLFISVYRSFCTASVFSSLKFKMADSVIVFEAGDEIAFNQESPKLGDPQSISAFTDYEKQSHIRSDKKKIFFKSYLERYAHKILRQIRPDPNRK